jgi:hypothetical protein
MIGTDRHLDFSGSGCLDPGVTPAKALIPGLQMLEARLKNYEAFQQLIQKWVGLEIEKSRQEMTRLSKPRKR